MLARPCARRLFRRFRLPPRVRGLWPRRGGVGPCTCCCCCKVCPGGGWCLPEYLHVKLQGLFFPPCTPPTPCPCNDWAWLEGQAGRLRRDGLPAVPCRTWSAVPCDTGDTAPCGPGGLFETHAGRYYGGGCGVAGQNSMACDCVTPLPDPAPVFGGLFAAETAVQCYQKEDGTSALGVSVVFVANGTATDSGYECCCWTPLSGPGGCSDFGLYVPEAGLGAARGTWTAGAVVCDEDGHFVSQLFTYTLPGGASGEILVYA